MQFVILIASLLIMGVVLSYIDRQSIRGKQLLIFFYLAIAMLSLIRGIFFSAVLFGIFALWQWVTLQRMQAGGSRPKRSKASPPSNLPSGCPPNCSGHDLTGLNLQGVNLQQADLSGTNLFTADLRNAKLSGANLSGVDLGGAKLQGADLRMARLEGADLRGANYDDRTIWPTNFNPPQAGAVHKA
jgi:hypothetical protein